MKLLKKLFTNNLTYNYNLFYSYILTKIFYFNCRLIRYPIFIRGKHKIYLGKNFTCGRFNRIDAFGENAEIKFGSNVQINDYNHISAVSKISIGDNCLIASNVFISDHNHGIFSDDSLSSGIRTWDHKYINSNDIKHSDPSIIFREANLSVKPVYIYNNVWIGQSVAILPGVTIGCGAVVGANSVVTKNIKPYTLSAGNPAKEIKYYEQKSQKWLPSL